MESIRTLLAHFTEALSVAASTTGKFLFHLRKSRGRQAPALIDLALFHPLDLPFPLLVSQHVSPPVSMARAQFDVCSQVHHCLEGWLNKHPGCEIKTNRKFAFIVLGIITIPNLYNSA